ncbi:hypothetical protein PLICRDRAFT_424720 [Plicaturopsis crispa FD-325 SS-3]|nr:hypothetical protein PLICRDRAFT_424720 [Plicaturopsis crispa FD-325 SS-3]
MHLHQERCPIDIWTYRVSETRSMLDDTLRSLMQCAKPLTRPRNSRERLTWGARVVMISTPLVSLLMGCGSCLSRRTKAISTQAYLHVQRPHRPGHYRPTHIESTSSRSMTLRRRPHRTRPYRTGPRYERGPHIYMMRCNICTWHIAIAHREAEPEEAAPIEAERDTRLEHTK